MFQKKTQRGELKGKRNTTLERAEPLPLENAVCHRDELAGDGCNGCETAFACIDLGTADQRGRERTCYSHLVFAPAATEIKDTKQTDCCWWTLCLCHFNLDFWYFCTLPSEL